jgi:hypothetical protein
MELVGPNGDIIIGNQYFAVHAEDILKTASSKEGLDDETENSLRIYGAEIIQKAGILLKLYPYQRKFFAFFSFTFRPQATISISQVLFHRFYFRVSFIQFDVRVSTHHFVSF